MWEEVFLFLVPFWIQIFDVFLDSVVLAYFDAINIEFCVVKCLIYIEFHYYTPENEVWEDRYESPCLSVCPSVWTRDCDLDFWPSCEYKLTSDIAF